MIQDTICAIATAQGGAIGSIRVSGPEAISITGSIFKPAKTGKLLSEQKPYTLTFGRIYDGLMKCSSAFSVLLIRIREKTVRKSRVMVPLIFFNR